MTYVLQRAYHQKFLSIWDIPYLTYHNLTPKIAAQLLSNYQWNEPGMNL